MPTNLRALRNRTRGLASLGPYVAPLAPLASSGATLELVSASAPPVLPPAPSAGPSATAPGDGGGYPVPIGGGGGGGGTGGDRGGDPGDGGDDGRIIRPPPPPPDPWVRSGGWEPPDRDRPPWTETSAWYQEMQRRRAGYGNRVVGAGPLGRARARAGRGITPPRPPGPILPPGAGRGGGPQIHRR